VKRVPSFVEPHIADQVIAGDDATQRANGALIVNLQLSNSAAFAAAFWIAVVLSGGAALLLRSWMPFAVAGLLLAALYFKLIFLMSRQVMREGVLPEYQAAYKRLYYSDAAFKKQVDDLRGRS